MRSWKLAAAAIAVAALAGAGIAYATIPGPGNVYTACVHRSNGAVRLIDPSLSSGPISRCTRAEEQVSWNQEGQQGPPGQSVVMGDAGANCANGGVSLTVGSDTRYVCNGAKGDKGDDGVFTGHFESPNHQYKLDVTDTGISLTGPQGMFRINASGITANAGLTLTLKGSAGVDVESSSTLDLKGGAIASLTAPLVRLNGCGGFVARLGDSVVVNPMSGFGNIVQGSPTVCAG